MAIGGWQIADGGGQMAVRNQQSAICHLPYAIADRRHTIMATSIDLIPSQRKLVHGWLLYAITAAAIAGTLAFAVAMTRTPGVRLLPSARAFQVILVGHVTFALTIWLLTFIATAW